MRRAVFPALMTLVFGGIASAELRIPGSVYEMDELEKAKAKASESEEPLIFVYTDPGTS